MIFLWVAFTLGFTGSLHCMGMCGPLSITMCSVNSQNNNMMPSILSYHAGRIITYSLLGGFIGLFSHLLLLSGFQKGISVLSGVLLIILALSTQNLDASLSNNSFGKWIGHLSGRLHKLVFSKSKKPNTAILGMLNGILPCGLVYIALAGALTSGNVWSGMMFMGAFGLGTLPLLFITTYYSGKISLRFPGLFQKILPGITIFLGLLMIMRGILIDTPLTLDFTDALKNPVLCH